MSDLLARLNPVNYLRNRIEEFRTKDERQVKAFVELISRPYQERYSLYKKGARALKSGIVRKNSPEWFAEMPSISGDDLRATIIYSLSRVKYRMEDQPDGVFYFDPEVDKDILRIADSFLP